MRKKLAILTNVVSPYRVPLFKGLNETFETFVVTGHSELNFADWTKYVDRLKESGIQVRVASGIIIRYARGRHLHINPGYLSFLFMERPDAVISLEFGFRSLCAVVYSLVRKTPLWLWSEGTPFTEIVNGRYRGFIRKLFVRTSARWITFGSGSSAYLTSIGVDRSRILELQNGVDDSLFTPGGPATGGRISGPAILVVGRLVPEKGLFELLESASRLQRSGVNFRLQIIGAGPSRTHLEAIVREKELREIEFLGNVSNSDLPQFYRDAHAMIFCTLQDVWGLVVNEALLCGTPVVCSKFAGCAVDLLDPEDIFDPLDPGELDCALLRAIEGKAKLPIKGRIWPMKKVVEKLNDEVSTAIGYQC